MDVLAESNVPGGAQILFLLGLGLMIFILLVRSRRYFRQATQYQVPRPPAKAPIKAAKASTAPSKEYEKWEVAMHELARDLAGQVDTKIRVLELLIREANEAAARLETALDRKSDPGSRLERLTAPKDASEPLSRDTHAALDDSPARTSIPKSARIKSSRGSKEPLTIAGNPRFERIFALADAGMSPTTIAKQIGSQVGEVELILSLRSTASQTGERPEE
jgi:hypothetical protein